MTMQSDNQGRDLADKMAMQMAILGVAIAIVLVLAFYFAW